MLHGGGQLFEGLMFEGLMFEGLTRALAANPAGGLRYRSTSNNARSSPAKIRKNPSVLAHLAT